MRWLAVLAGLLLAVPAVAQEWPSRNIRVVVPYPAGGPAGFRTAAGWPRRSCRRNFGVSVVVGTAPAPAAPSAPRPCGSRRRTAIPSSPHPSFSHSRAAGGEGRALRSRRQFHGDRALLRAVADRARQPGCGARQDARRCAAGDHKSKPNDFRFGISALGSPNHLAVLEFNKLTKLDLQIIPYRGSAPALTDLRQRPGAVDDRPHDHGAAAGAGRQAEGAGGGKQPPDLRCFLTFRPLRKAELAGLEFSSWYGLWGPKDLPKGLSLSALTPCWSRPCASLPWSRN